MEKEKLRGNPLHNIRGERYTNINCNITNMVVDINKYMILADIVDQEECMLSDLELILDFWHVYCTS